MAERRDDERGDRTPLDGEQAERSATESAGGSAAEAPVASVLALAAAVSRGEQPTSREIARAAAGLGIDDDERPLLTSGLAELTAEVAGLRERRRELIALTDSARQLANASSVDETLDAVVRRAHDIVRADIAYLSEYDPETGALRVRAVHGITGEPFTRLPVPAGTGLASQVARSRRPRAVLDYFASPDFERSEAMDAVVRAEGLVSIVGVPLVANSMVLGVLFAATRSPHEYRADEMTILAALADHAAIALLRSMRMGDLERSGRAAAGELAEWERFFSDHRRALDVVDSLFDEVLSGADVHRVVAAFAEAVGRDIVLADSAGDVLADSEQRRRRVDIPADAERTPVPTGAGPHAEGRADGESTTEDEPASGPVLCRTESHPDFEGLVEISTRAAGALTVLIGRDGQSSPLHPETMVRGAQVCASAWIFAAAEQVRSDATRNRIMASLLTGAGGEEAVRAHFLAQRLRDDEVDALLCIGGAPEPVAAASVRIGGEGLVVGRHAGAVCVLGSAATIARVAERVAARMDDGVELFALRARVRTGTGDSGPFDAIRRAWAQCIRLRPVVEGLGWRGGVVDAASLMPFSALFGPDRDSLEDFLAATIGPLLDAEADGRGGEELLATLEAYFRAGRNAKATAEATSFHPNTVAQRLRRVDSLLGAQWREPDRAFLVEAAVRVRMLDRRLRR